MKEWSLNNVALCVKGNKEFYGYMASIKKAWVVGFIPICSYSKGRR